MVRGGAGGQGAMETPTGKAGTNYADDATADKLLQNESMVDFLARKGGLRLTKAMTLEQRREAIRQAVAQIINTKTETTAPEKAQKIDLAVQRGNGILNKITARFSEMGGIEGGGEEKAGRGVPGIEVSAGASTKNGNGSGIQKRDGRIFESFGRMAAFEGRITDSFFGIQPVKAWAKEALVTPIGTQDSSVLGKTQKNRPLITRFSPF